jgi:hypothetical protein
MAIFSSPSFAVTAIFVLLGLMHVYWALGGRLGRGAALPQLPVPPGWQKHGEPAMVNAFNPGPAVTLVVAVALIAVGGAVALRGGLFAAPVQHVALQAMLAARGAGDVRPRHRRLPAGRVLQAHQGLGLCAHGHLGVFALVRGAGPGCGLDGAFLTA